MTVDAIDVANYTTIPTAAQLACLKSIGCHRAIVGTSYGTIGRAQLQAFQSAGITIDIYAWISFATNWKYLIDKALDQATGLDIKYVWLDAEGDVYGLLPEQVVQRIRDAVEYTRTRTDAKIGIYTAAWWWRPYTRDYGSPDICRLPLWYAAYGTPQERWLNGEAFGGWMRSDLAMKQWAGTVPTCGLNTDQNIILRELDDVAYVTKEQFDAAILELLLFGSQQGLQIREIAMALARHIQEHSDVSTSQKIAEFQAIVDSVVAQQTEFGDKLRRLADVLDD